MHSTVNGCTVALFPYLVKKITNDVVYRIQQEGQRKFKVVHLDRLAKYNFIDGLPVRDEQA